MLVPQTPCYESGGSFQSVASLRSACPAEYIHFNDVAILSLQLHDIGIPGARDGRFIQWTEDNCQGRYMGKASLQSYDI